MRVNKGPYLLFALTFAIVSNVFGQLRNSPTPFFSYYYDYKLANPALVGAKTKHLFNTVYNGVPDHTDVQLFYTSYERNISSISSGAGGVFVHDRVGPETRIHYGVLYSYKLALNERSDLRFGTHLMYQTRHLDLDYYRAIDPDDPLIPHGDHTEHSFNFDAGVVYNSPFVTIGAAVKNGIDRTNDPLMFDLLVTRKFAVSRGLKLEPSLLYFSNSIDRAVCVNNIFEIRQWILFGVGFTAGKNSKQLSMNAGVNINNWVQIIGHLYSSAANDPYLEMMVRATIPERK